MAETAPVALLARLSELRDDAERLAKQWRKAATIAGRFKGADDLADVTALSKAAKGLGELDLPGLGELAARLSALAERERRERRFRIRRQVLDAFKAAGEEPAPLGGDPPSFRVGPAVVELREGKNKAVISYARVVIAEAPLVASKVVQAHADAVAALREGARPAAEVRALLLAAYRVCLARQDKAFGDRIDAVDLLPEVALAVQGDRFRADPTRGAFADYGRARFAFDLAAVAAAGLLRSGGTRLELGPATMGSATGKRGRALWLQVGPGGHQFYRSLRFAPDGGDRS